MLGLTPIPHHLLRPLRGGAAGVIIVFSILFYIAGKAGLFGILLGIILASWLIKYAYILFDHTVRGFDDPPALDIQMLNPLDEWRPMAQIIILCLIYAATKLIDARLGNAAAIGVILLTVALLPASIAILGLEGNPFKALYPPALARMIKGLGLLYGLVLALMLGVVAGVAWLASQDLWALLQYVISLFTFLSLFSLLGGALYERRHELGLETWTSPEQVEQDQREDTLRESIHTVTEAYGLTRAGSHLQAWQLLQNWLSTRGFTPADYHWLCGRVASWTDPRYITRLTQDYLERLLTLKRNGEALDVLSHRLSADLSFRPKTAESTLTLAQLAARGGGARKVALTLLIDFPTRFPGSPTISLAHTLAQELKPPH